MSRASCEHWLGRPQHSKQVRHDASQRPVLDQFASLRPQVAAPGSFVGDVRPIAVLPCVATDLAADVMVDGALPSRAATERIDLPTIRAREISSRSARVSAVPLRLRSSGRMPPVFDKRVWIEV